MGQPINHSTHGGFRFPPTFSLSGRAFLSCVACDAFPDFQSRAVGVGHFSRIETASIRFPPLRVFRGVTRPPCVPSDERGVGHILATPSRLGIVDPFRWLCRSRPHASCTVGVGKNPDPLSEMGRSGFGSAKHSPSRIVPCLGQVSENSSQPPRSKSWRVFHERELGSYFANDPGHFHPKSASFSVESITASCN
jgi:hypothetical protein